MSIPSRSRISFSVGPNPTTGEPAASASIITSPKDSLWEGRQTSSAARITPITALTCLRCS